MKVKNIIEHKYKFNCNEWGNEDMRLKIEEISEKIISKMHLPKQIIPIKYTLNFYIIKEKEANRVEPMMPEILEPFKRKIENDEEDE